MNAMLHKLFTSRLAHMRFLRREGIINPDHQALGATRSEFSGTASGHHYFRLSINSSKNCITSVSDMV